METVSGIFKSRADAEKAVQQLHSQGIKNDRIAMLTPGADSAQAEDAVPTSDSEQPGMGKAMGGTVGGAMGAAGGATLGAAAASLLVPGVGPIIAGTIIGAALLGAGGAVGGMAAGEALEEGLVSGLPHDELYVYEDAVRQGRSVVIAFVETDETEEAARKTFSSSGAESIDDARETWWVGLRDAEEADYQRNGGNFQTDEANYRRGFETALSGESEPDGTEEAFRRGYQRGKDYQRSVKERYKG